MMLVLFPATDYQFVIMSVYILLVVQHCCWASGRSPVLVGSGAVEPRGPGGQLTPTFSGAGSTYGA